MLPKTSRRQFLAIAAAGVLSAEDGPDQKASKHDMIVRSTRPEDLEMPLAGFTDYITPVEHFFVRTHVYVPRVNLSDWRLSVEGEVATPLTLTMEDLRKLPAVELVSVLECAGNGRSFYSPTVPGLQWGQGAVGNGRWRGVRLADVLRRAGIRPNAVEILFDGADSPIGTMPDFQRGITAKKAMDPHTILAYEMNGATLPSQHGFPLRVIAPGWASDSWIKWLTAIRVLDKDSPGFWMKSAYRIPLKPVAPGMAIAADAMNPVTRLRPKSVIASPAPGSQIKAGQPVTIKGVAWSGDLAPIVRVDISVDDGRSWRPAKLDARATPFGWRQWEAPWTPSAGYTTILARAHDAMGGSQPLVQEWNPSGYLYNAVARCGVDAVESPGTAAVSKSEPGGEAQPPGFRASCLSCHQEDVIQQQRLTRAQWDREITKMTGWGSPVKAEDRDRLLDFLSGNYR